MKKQHRKDMTQKVFRLSEHALRNLKQLAKKYDRPETWVIENLLITGGLLITAHQPVSELNPNPQPPRKNI